jgi:hypothetical protein
MATIVFPLPAQQPEEDLRRPALSLADEARAITVTSDTYQVAAEKLLACAAMRKKIEEHHAPLKQKAHEAHKAICEAEKSLLSPILEAERILKSGIGAYDLEQRRIAEERERKEREEQGRLAAEMLEASIEEAEANGASAEEVAAIIEAPLVIPRAPAAHAVQKVSGVATATVWKAEVIDMAKLVAYIATPAGRQFLGLVQPNTTAMNSLARSLKNSVNIPGVRVYPEAQVRAGGRK